MEGSSNNNNKICGNAPNQDTNEPSLIRATTTKSGIPRRVLDRKPAGLLNVRGNTPNVTTEATNQSGQSVPKDINKTTHEQLCDTLNKIHSERNLPQDFHPILPKPCTSLPLSQKPLPSTLLSICTPRSQPQKMQNMGKGIMPSGSESAGDSLTNKNVIEEPANKSVVSAESAQKESAQSGTEIGVLHNTETNAGSDMKEVSPVGKKFVSYAAAVAMQEQIVSPRQSRASLLRAARAASPRASSPLSFISSPPKISLMHTSPSSRAVDPASEPLMTSYNAFFSPLGSRPTSPMEKIYPSVPNKSALSPLRRTSSSPSQRCASSPVQRILSPTRHFQKLIGFQHDKTPVYEGLSSAFKAVKPDSGIDTPKLVETSKKSAFRPAKSSSPKGRKSAKTKTPLRNTRSCEVPSAKSTSMQPARGKSQQAGGVKSSTSCPMATKQPPVVSAVDEVVTEISPELKEVSDAVSTSKASEKSDKSILEPKEQSSPPAIETDIQKPSNETTINEANQEKRSTLNPVILPRTKHVSRRPLKLASGSFGRVSVASTVAKSPSIGVTIPRRSSSRTSQNTVKEENIISHKDEQIDADNRETQIAQKGSESTLEEIPQEPLHDKEVPQKNTMPPKEKNDKLAKKSVELTVKSAKDAGKSLNVEEASVPEHPNNQEQIVEPCSKLDVKDSQELPQRIVRKSSSLKIVPCDLSTPIKTSQSVIFRESTPKVPPKSKFSQVHSKIDTGRTIQRSGSVAQKAPIQRTDSVLQKPSAFIQRSPGNQRTSYKNVQSKINSRVALATSKAIPTAKSFQAKEPSTSKAGLTKTAQGSNPSSLSRSQSKIVQRKPTMNIQTSRIAKDVSKPSPQNPASKISSTPNSVKTLKSPTKGFNVKQTTAARMASCRRQKSCLSLQSGAPPPLAPKSVSSDVRLSGSISRDRQSQDLKKEGREFVPPPSPKRSSSSCYLSSGKRFGSGVGPKSSARQKSSAGSEGSSQNASNRDKYMEGKRLKVLENLEKQLQILQTEFLTKYENLRINSADKLKCSYKLVTMVRDEDFKLLINKEDLIKISKNPSKSSLNEFKAKLKDFLNENLNAFIDRLMLLSEIPTSSEKRDMYVGEIREELQKLTDAHLDGLCQEVDSLILPNKADEEQIKKLEDQLKETKDQSVQLESKIYEMIQKHENEKEAFQIALTEKAQAEISKKEMLIEDLRAKIEFLETERSEEMEKRNDELTERQRAVVISLEAKIDALVDEIAVLKGKLHTVEVERDEKHQENKTISEKLQKSEFKNSTIASELVECKRSAKKQAELDSKYAEEAQKATEEIANLRTELSSAYQELEKMQQKVTACEIDNARYDSLMKDYEMCQERIRDLTEKLNVLSNENMEAMVSDNQSLKDSKQSEVNELKLSLCKEMKMREHVEDLLNRKEEELGARLLLIKEMQASETECRKQNQELKTELQVTKETALRQANELQERSEELRKLSKIFRERCNALNDQNHLVDALHASNERHQLLRVRHEEKIAMLEAEKRHLKDTIELYTSKPYQPYIYGSHCPKAITSKQISRNHSTLTQHPASEPPGDGPCRAFFPDISSFFEPIPAPDSHSSYDEIEQLLDDDSSDDHGLQEAFDRDFETHSSRRQRRRSNDIVVRKYER